jgi:hydroxymethylpyrimidine pyrophosphatase-like HAD family hydrolase
VAFHLEGLDREAREVLAQTARAHGFATIASSIHFHIYEPSINKGAALARLAHDRGLVPDEVLTLGDSTTDEQLFDPARFPVSVAVANIAPYLRAMTHLPAYVTAAREGHGFLEVAGAIMAARAAS